MAKIIPFMRFDGGEYAKAIARTKDKASEALEEASMLFELRAAIDKGDEKVIDELSMRFLQEAPAGRRMGRIRALLRLSIEIGTKRRERKTT